MKNNIFYLLVLILAITPMNSQDMISKSCQLSILDFGAKMDGVSDDYAAIMASLKSLDYAFIPSNENGAYITKEIILTDGQRIFGTSRKSKIVSSVPEGKAAIKVMDIPFSGDAKIEDITLKVNTKSIGIHILDSRNVFVDNISVKGSKICTAGILIDGGDKKGSAWNQVTRYTVIHCEIGISLTSATKKNWCNRNYIGFGVVQSCDIGIRLKKSNTNKIEANPQGCAIGFSIRDSHYNRFETFLENSKDKAIYIAKTSRQNVFSGGFPPSKVDDNGVDNDFVLNKKKQLVMDEKMRLKRN